MQPPQKKTLLQRWKESIGEWPLLGKIVAWVVLAILAFAAVMCCLWHLTSEPGKYVASIAATSLTIVGGVGAVAYLVIKYQERQQAGRDEERAKREERREEDRLVNTKMQDAVDQLGSDRASTRIAGVYALTDVADTYGGGYRQRVVDILCGYLRSDRETYPLGADGKSATDQPRSGDADKAVESTIIAVMRNHLLKERKDDNREIRVQQIVRDDQLWCDCAFDLHGVAFHEGVNFMESTFECYTNLCGSVFKGYVNFCKANFNIVDFREATFKGYANFSGAAFKSHANFDRAVFDDFANFCGAAFKSFAHFFGAVFRCRAKFLDIRGMAFTLKKCKFNGKFRGTDVYEWGPIEIPEDNDGLPEGAVWVDFPEKDDKDDGATPIDR